jgi:SAM-dependent methyltransferase
MIERLFRKLAKLWATQKRVVIVFRQYYEIKNKSDKRFLISWKDRWLCLNDNTSTTDFDRHYVFHTGWACRILAETKPTHHIDISSSLYFVALASAFTRIRFYDYRPANLGLSNLECAEADLLNLKFEDNSIKSLSCMHVVEHIGLGRYGDPLDHTGDLRAISELKRVLEVGGQLLFFVPIGGTARIQFNAHRIYTYSQVISMFDGFELLEFSLIPDSDSPAKIIRHASQEISDKQRYGCGCFLFKKANQ